MPGPGHAGRNNRSSADLVLCILSGGDSWLMSDYPLGKSHPQ